MTTTSSSCIDAKLTELLETEEHLKLRLEALIEEITELESKLKPNLSNVEAEGKR